MQRKRDIARRAILSILEAFGETEGGKLERAAMLMADAHRRTVATARAELSRQGRIKHRKTYPEELAIWRLAQ
jgi:hypothetical protein